MLLKQQSEFVERMESMLKPPAPPVGTPVHNAKAAPTAKAGGKAKAASASSSNQFAAIMLEGFSDSSEEEDDEPEAPAASSRPALPYMAQVCMNEALKSLKTMRDRAASLV